MPLRKHQSEMNQVIDGIISGHPKFKETEEIILSVVVGGGKGSVPVNADKLIMAGMGAHPRPCEGGVALGHAGSD